MDIRFTIEYFTRWGESLSIVAEDVKYPMHWEGNGVWSVTVPDCGPDFLRDYSYVVIEDGIIVRTEWEHHSARKAKVIRDEWKSCPIPGCPFPRRHSAEIFDRPGFRGAGTAVPVFSLRTRNDFGTGEFNDLVPLIDWAAATGQCIIQLLPVNDTTRRGEWGDSYPYSPASSFALHPLYINLQDIGVKADAAFRKLQSELNALEELDYPRVFREKTALMRKAFEDRGAKDMSGSAYRKFYAANAYWLGEYAEFCARRDSLEPEYYAWIQYHLDRQFSKVVAYAHSKGVYLKGDLPIGVGGDGADACWHPELFNLDSSAGAPPDYFSADGQNWGFPTYNWEEMAKDDYAWWKARLRKMAEYFDAFRIDHILGFFRIWEIPSGEKSGKAGHFNPAIPYPLGDIEAAGLPVKGLFHPDPRNPGMYQPLIAPDSGKLPFPQNERFGAMYEDFFFRRNEEFWRRNAERKLPELLGATGMLACGEDLGMVPACVPGVMEKERILSLKMKGMSEDGAWPELSVCATSSHDMQPLRMQGAEDPSPRECADVLSRFLASPSMLAIFPIQDWLSISPDLRNPDRNERINEPADPAHHWRWRLHVDVGSLAADGDFCARVRELIKNSRRTV